MLIICHVLCILFHLIYLIRWDYHVFFFFRWRNEVHKGWKTCPRLNWLKWPVEDSVPTLWSSKCSLLPHSRLSHGRITPRCSTALDLVFWVALLMIQLFKCFSFRLKRIDMLISFSEWDGQPDFSSLIHQLLTRYTNSCTFLNSQNKNFPPKWMRLNITNFIGMLCRLNKTR